MSTSRRGQATAGHHKDSDEDEFGPLLPPAMLREMEEKTKGQTFGPLLPKEVIKPEDMISTSLPKEVTFGPVLPPDVSDEPAHTTSFSSPSFDQEDVIDDFIGPLPPKPDSASTEDSEKRKRKQEIEARSNQMKNKLSSKEDPGQIVREEWMLELPPEINPNATAVSMTSRKFRTKYTEIGDRSVWTDTPADKAKKATEERQKMKSRTEDETTSISKRDEKLSDEIEQYNKLHRGETLVEMHRKRKAEEQEGSFDTNKHQRRPFDRDIDLQLPQSVMTGAKRKTLIKDSASSLGSKFTHGRQHFL